MPATPFPPDWQTLGDHADWERVLIPLLQDADAAIASKSVPAMQQASRNLKDYYDNAPAFAADLKARAAAKMTDLNLAIMAQSAKELRQVAALQPHLDTIAAFVAAAASQAYTESLALAGRPRSGPRARAASFGSTEHTYQRVISLLRQATRPAPARRRNKDSD